MLLSTYDRGVVTMYRDMLQLKMLDFVIFAFTAVAGLLLILFYLWVNGFFKKVRNRWLS